MDKKVIVYGTETCPYCLRAKQFLINSGVEFEYIDVSEDPVKSREMMDKSGQMGVPVIDIDGEMIVGFDKAQIIKALGL